MPPHFQPKGLLGVCVYLYPSLNNPSSMLRYIGTKLHSWTQDLANIVLKCVYSFSWVLGAKINMYQTRLFIEISHISCGSEDK